MHCIIVLVSVSFYFANGFHLEVIHTNDMHSRIDETTAGTGRYTPNSPGKPYGGFSRLASVVWDLKKRKSNVIFLNAGDTYQGTPYYTFFKYQVLLDLMPNLGIDAMSLGNHEFDDNVQGLVPFLSTIGIPVVTCNLNTSLEPSFKNAKYLRDYVILNVDNTKVAVIGYLTPDTKFIASIGNTIIYDEIPYIKKAAVNAKEDGAKIIIALGHSGFEMDKKIAAEVNDVDLVVGGHSDTFLYTGTPPDKEVAEDVYPTMIVQSTGKKVPVVQAYGYTKYLGDLNLEWNENFKLVSAIGNPILLNSFYPKNETVEEKVKFWRNKYEIKGLEKVGITKVNLDNKLCRIQECILGNLCTDAFVMYAREKGIKNPLAVVNGGSIRSGTIIANGNEHQISMEELLTIFPFSSSIMRLSLNGSSLIRLFEDGVKHMTPNHGVGGFLQTSEIKVVYDISRKPGSRVKSIYVRESEQYMPLKTSKIYDLITTSYVYDGGDQIEVKKYSKLVETFELDDIGILKSYFRSIRAYDGDIEGRISFEQDQMTGSCIRIKLDFLLSSFCLFYVMLSVLLKYNN